jgi:radical SAM protein with 4Fe4S-binding SPASM domain
MEYHISRKIEFGLITSGYASSEIDLMLLSKARWVRVSLDTVNAFAYQESRGGELTVDMVIDSIELMKAAGVNVELTITVHKHNTAYLNELFEWAYMHRISIDIHPIFGRTFSKDENMAIARWRYSFINKGLTFQPHEFNSYQFEKCSAVYYQCFIDASGDIYPCCNAAGDTRTTDRMKPLGNIKDWKEHLRLRNNFHNSDVLPDFCKSCIDRFRSINHVCDDIVNKNSFF